MAADRGRLYVQRSLAHSLNTRGKYFLFPHLKVVLHTELCYTQGMEATETKRRKPPQRRGVFLGAWVMPRMKSEVQAVADREYYGNLSMAMMKLLDEALTARERGAGERLPELR